MRRSLPKYVPSSQVPTSKHAPTRKRLRDMSEDEQCQELRRLHQGVTSQIASTQSYLDGRATRNIRTSTDVLYEQFQELDHDLLALLEELIEEAEKEP